MLTPEQQAIIDAAKLWVTTDHALGATQASARPDSDFDRLLVESLRREHSAAENRLVEAVYRLRDSQPAPRPVSLLRIMENNAA